MQLTTTHTKTSGLAVLLALSALAIVAALVLSAPAGAATGKHRPAAAVRGHALGLALPKRQVNARRIRTNAIQSLPTQIDLRTAADLAAPVRNQGSVGSCVTWAIDYAMLGWYSRHSGRPQSFNPMYTYSQIHLTNDAEGGGSYPQDALRIAVQQGNDTMAHYTPTDTTDFWTTPDASEAASAASYKISGWTTVFQYTNGLGNGTTSADALKAALASGKPVAIGVQVRPGFDQLQYLEPRFGVAGNDDNDGSGASKGAHEILAIGYDQYGVWFQNSWGDQFGDRGYGRMTWSVVGHDVFSAHTISGLAAAPAADTTAPTMTSLTQRLATGYTASSTAEPVEFTWSATDNVGVAGYAVYLQKDGGTFVQDTTLTSATSVAYSLDIGHSYRLAVAAKDARGNQSGYQYTATFTPKILDSASFSASSSWATYNLTDAIGGSYVASSTAGVSRTFSFTGSDAALVAPKFSNAGQARILCDGVASGTIDLYSASTVGRTVTARCHFSASAAHTMQVVVSGTSGRPWVGIDAFTYLA